MPVPPCGPYIPQIQNDADPDVKVSAMQAAISGLSAVYQPLDSDLTAIAALSTTSYGRNLLALANQAALQAAVVAAQTGTGSTFAMQASPTFTGTVSTAAISASGTITASASTNPLIATGTSGASSTRVVVNSSGVSNVGILLRELGVDRWSIASYSGGRFTFYNEATATESLGITASNRMLVGGATDDGSTRLQVNGAITASGPVKLSANNVFYQAVNTVGTTRDIIGIDNNNTLIVQCLGGAMYFRADSTITWNIGGGNVMTLTSAGLLTPTGGYSPPAVTFAVLNATTATATLGERRITDRGNRRAYPDGTNWKFVSDDAIIS